MKKNETIDLHMHTTVSDGTDTPEEILARVRDAGIDLFSVTDHDAIKAAGIIPGILSDGDPAFLPGVELSCRDGVEQRRIDLSAVDTPYDIPVTTDWGSNVIHVDETPVRVKNDNRDGSHNSFMWVYRSGEMCNANPVIIYDYQKTRKRVA